MNNEFYQKEEFRYWLINSLGISADSAKSYLSYVSNANKTVVIDCNELKSLFEILNSKNSNDKIRLNTIEIIIQELSRKNAEKIFGRKLKTLQNYKSGLFAYLNFLIESDSIAVEDEQDYANTESDIELNEICIVNEYSQTLDTADEDVFVFSKEDIINTFIRRMNTQDRHYENIFYPIRFIISLFSIIGRRKEFDEWNKKQIGSINLLTDNNKVKLNQIGKLIIDKSSNVFVTKKGVVLKLYTKLADKITIEPMKSSNLKQIAIDHEISLYEIMNNSISNLKLFNLITEELKKQIKNNEKEFKKSKLSKYQQLSKVSTQKYIKNNIDKDFINQINPTELLNELNIIFSNTRLQLMDSKYNTSKGKK